MKPTATDASTPSVLRAPAPKSPNFTGGMNTSALTNGKRETIANDPHYVTEVDELRGMIFAQDDRAWTIGERVLQLREWTQENYGKPLAFAKLAADLAIPNVKGNYLNRLYLNAKLFPKERRDLHPLWSWFEFDKLRRAQSRMVKAKSPNTKQRTATEEELNKLLAEQPKTVRDFIVKQSELRAKRNKSKSRKVVQKRKAVYGADALSLINRCHHADWQTVMDRIPSGAIDGMVADPPFPRVGNYYSNLKNPMRVLGNECDNASPTETIATTLPLFDHADRFAAGGFILLFQEGGYPLDSRIIQRAEQNGWTAYREIHLIKVDDDGDADSTKERKLAFPAPGFMDEPFAPIEIKVTLFFLKGYMPIRIGVLTNQNVFYFKSTSRRAVAEVKSGQAEACYRHHFECPPEVLEALLTRLLHTETKQLIFEPFGCTAPACVSAIRNGWDWIYAETNERNYQRGLERIEEAANANKQSLLFPTEKKNIHAA